MSQATADLRRDYDRDMLLEMQAAADPLVQFRRWFDDALAGEIYEPNAMALATVGPDGQPSLRMVLLKDFDRHGFVFYTNLESRKAMELAGNARASLLFWWDRLHRQVRIEGRVEPVDPEHAQLRYARRQLGTDAAPSGGRPDPVDTLRATHTGRLRRRQLRYGSHRFLLHRGRAVRGAAVVQPGQPVSRASSRA